MEHYKTSEKKKKNKNIRGYQRKLQMFLSCLRPDTSYAGLNDKNPVNLGTESKLILHSQSRLWTAAELGKEALQ